MSRIQSRAIVCVALFIGVVGASMFAHGTGAPRRLDEVQLGLGQRMKNRIAMATTPRARPVPRGRAIGSMTPGERRAAVDAFWGDGPSTAVKLQTFDKFWKYVDDKFAAFQGIDVDWAALRARYRGEIAAGVSRGRFAAIINQLSLALRDSHTIPLDLPVNFDTVPEPGVPLMGVSGWEFDTSGACGTAQDDGSALIYSALPHHPLGLERGDRILGYDGRPWRELYQELLREELPLWPLWWGTSPSSFDHTFVMSAGLNWHLFDTMDIAKHSTGQVEHVPTSLMPGAIFWGFCSEQMNVAGVPKPNFFAEDFVSAGVIAGTRIGYIYSWAWDGTAEEDFAAAVEELTERQQVEALIIDFRFNEGGSLSAPFRGLGALFDHPVPTLGMDERKTPANHFDMKSIFPPSVFNLDFEDWFHAKRSKTSYAGPIAVLVGPGAVSAGDYSALWSTFLPRVRTFGKPTSMAAGFPTQPFLGTELDLGPDWEATVAETNTWLVGAPRDYLIHSEFPVDEPVWLRPDDVANGRDTVVDAAVKWLNQQLGR